jgi:hypothetical protein
MFSQVKPGGMEPICQVRLERTEVGLPRRQEAKKFTRIFLLIGQVLWPAAGVDGRRTDTHGTGIMV